MNWCGESVELKAGVATFVVIGCVIYLIATDSGYGKSVAVSMDIVDEGQAHLDALQELAERRQRINREKTPAEAT